MGRCELHPRRRASSAAAATSACRWRSRSLTAGRPVPGSTTSSTAAVDTVDSGRCRSTSRAPTTCSSARSPPGAPGADRPGGRRRRRARRRRHRHAGRRAPQPRPAAPCPRRIEELRADLRDGQLLVLRSTVYPGVTALVERLLARARPRRRRRVLPGAHRRGQGDDRAVRRCRRSCRAAPTRAVERAAQLFGTLTDADRRARARRGRAGQAVHQHLALHQVRRRQPVLHDRQRLRASTSSGSAQALTHDYPRAADMPGAGLRRRPVPVQGHDAARGVQRQQLHARPRGMLVNEGLPLYLVAPARAAATTWRR